MNSPPRARSSSSWAIASALSPGWWPEHYGGLAAHLERRGRAVVREPGTCVVYALAPAAEAAA